MNLDSEVQVINHRAAILVLYRSLQCDNRHHQTHLSFPVLPRLGGTQNEESHLDIGYNHHGLGHFSDTPCHLHLRSSSEILAK